jgi:hypothetical protein
MNVRYFIGITGMLAAVVVCTGCDTTKSQMASDYNNSYQRILNQEMQDGGSSDSQSETPPQQDDVVRLATMNISLLRSNALLVSENAQLKTNNLTYMNFLQINDAINENKYDLIRKFQNDYSKKKEAIFEAVGESGRILDFQVQDVCFYKSKVVVIMEFLWANEDNSGCLGRVGLSLNTDKDYTASDCSMLGKTLISAQELATVTSQSGSVQDQQQQARQIEASKSSEMQSPAKTLSTFQVSNQTKNTLIQEGAAILGAIIINHEFNSGSNN